MTKKIYYIVDNDKNMPVVMSRDVIAETEYHWTYRGHEGQPRVVSKSNCGTWSASPQESIDVYLYYWEKNLDQTKKYIESRIARMQYMKDNREKIIEEIDKS